MPGAKIHMVFFLALAALLIALPVRYSDCGSTATASPAEEKYGLICMNLKQDWNYLFHPDRVNQCKPRELAEDKAPGA